MRARHPAVLVQVPGGSWGRFAGKEHGLNVNGLAALLTVISSSIWTVPKAMIGQSCEVVCAEWETFLSPCGPVSAKVLRDCRLDMQLTYLP
ncbi:hypothetical protein LZ32DRAFT_605292, partial [Colletotrichum eremochloae]